MPRITFKIPVEKRAEAIKSLKAALPKLKNAQRCINMGEFNLPEDMVEQAVKAMQHIATEVSVSRESTPRESEAEVTAAETRLAEAFDKLGDKLAVKMNKKTAALLNSAADFLDSL